MLKEIISFTLGAAAGAAVTYVITARQNAEQIRKVEDKVNKELARLEREYSKYNNTDQADTAVNEEPVDKIDSSELIGKASFNDYKTELGKTNYSKKSKKPKKIVEPEINKEPYIISADDYADGGQENDKVTLTYFEREDKFLDMRTNTVFEDGALVCGPLIAGDAQLWDENDTMFIRNDEFKIDCEVLRNEEESIYDYLDEETDD